MNIFKYITLGAVLIGITSCGNDWLNLEPSTSIPTDTSIKVLSDIEFTLNGIYSQMQSSDAYSGRLIYYGDATGDDMQAVSSTKRCANYYRFNWTKDSGPSTHWSILYSIITSCNVILNKIDDIPFDEDETDYRNDLKGQALAIRGLAYFDLTRIFGYPYTKDNGASMGVPIILEETDRFNKPSRATVAQCYERITKDLDDAWPLLSEEFNKGKINRWAAMTLLSRAYLYRST